MTFTTKVEILMFAGARDQIGAESVQVELCSPCTVAQLKESLVRSRSELAVFVKHGRIAFNQAFVEDDAILDLKNCTSAIALIPPVSGG